MDSSSRFRNFESIKMHKYNKQLVGKHQDMKRNIKHQGIRQKKNVFFLVSSMRKDARTVV